MISIFIGLNDKVYVNVYGKTKKGIVKDYKSKSVWYKLSDWLEYLVLTEDADFLWVTEDKICYR